jgi:molybdenum-dependent DNA-binding transcriptional regulator ModE
VTFAAYPESALIKELGIDTKDEAAATLVADAMEEAANEPQQLARRGGILALKAICTEFAQGLFQALPSLKTDVDAALSQLVHADALSNDQVQGIIEALTVLESRYNGTMQYEQW